MINLWLIWFKIFEKKSGKRNHEGKNWKHFSFNFKENKDCSFWLVVKWPLFLSAKCLMIIMHFFAYTLKLWSILFIITITKQTLKVKQWLIILCWIMRKDYKVNQFFMRFSNELEMNENYNIKNICSVHITL